MLCGLLKAKILLDEFQPWNELNGCKGKEQLKAGLQVFENKRCHWIMKHGEQIKKGGNLHEFGKLKATINENNQKNIKKKQQKLYLIIRINGNFNNNGYCFIFKHACNNSRT